MQTINKKTNIENLCMFHFEIRHIAEMLFQVEILKSQNRAMLKKFDDKNKQVVEKTMRELKEMFQLTTRKP